MAKSGSVKERFEASMRRSDRFPQIPPTEERIQPAAVVEISSVTRVTVELPIAAERDANANCGPIHLDGVDLTRDQSNKLRRIAAALDKAGATCETRSGRRRATHWRHAIRYILDQVEA